MEFSFLDLAEVSTWCRNPRRNFGGEAMAELVESVKRLGVQTPVMVRPVADWEGDDAVKTEFVLVCGERRYRAAKAAGLSRIPVAIRQDLSERVAFEVALVENLDRDGLDVFEEAEAYKELISFGYSVAELAERFGKSRDWMGQQLALLKLGDAERAELLAGTIAVRTAVELLKVADEESRSRALAEVVHPKFQEGPLSRDRAVALVRDQYVRPEVEERDWEARREELEANYAPAEVLTYEESRECAAVGSRWVSVEAKPGFQFDFLCRVDPLGGEDDERPVWGKLADLYGAKKVVAAPVEAGNPVRILVAWEPLYLADIENAMGKDAVFRKPGNTPEGKAERLEEARDAEAEAVREKELEGEIREVITQLTGGALASVAYEVFDWWINEAKQVDLCRFVFEFLYPDLESGEETVREWVRQLVKKRGVEVIPWIYAAEELILGESGKVRREVYAKALGGCAEEFPGIFGEKG